LANGNKTAHPNPLFEPMTVRVGINGFGRIGRNILRSWLQSGRTDVEFVAVNDLTDAATLAHLLSYDSVHGRLPAGARAENGMIRAGGRDIRVLSEPSPRKLPWGDLGADIVIESTGRFRGREAAAGHLAGGASKVIISAPGVDPDCTVVLGVNEGDYDPSRHDIVSNASCTTNCISPVVKVIMDSFGFERGLMTTVHAYTNGQRLLDLPHKDLRRSRAAALSIIPTSTGAARAVGLVLPETVGKLDGMAMRVPTPDVSTVDLVAETSRDVTVNEVNAALRAAAEGPLSGILEYCDTPLVSVDFTGNPASSIVDSEYTAVMGNSLVKIVTWYDNEWGYSNRCVDLAAYIGGRLQG